MKVATFVAYVFLSFNFVTWLCKNFWGKLSISLYQDVDKDNSGRLSFDNFLNLMSTKMSEKDTKEEILKAFKLFDDDDTGKISFENLKRVAHELGENLTDEELQVRS